ncbi:MAG: hypothetical protein DWC09_03435 [Candidatus Poseidoniales archaeon]|nr:MAG: hypothetical protein DWC09_03435 [Candidatus Poseidoniales archaeon]
MRVAVGLVLCLLLSGLPVASAQSDSNEDTAWPGDPIDSHVHMTWAALTLEVNEWADNNPDIVDLVSVGESELGKSLWVVRLSDWSVETKANGNAKEIVYIDGGHHGNEYLGTSLAWLTAKWYIDGWAEGKQEVIDVLQNTEVHVLIMLNPDGNDIDTRWNINQVDLNRNYDHYWNTCPTTQPGSSAFSESETAANSAYMNTEVPDADLYVTMHTGVWIMLYPWGKWPEQPADWELYHQIREDVNNDISSIPIQNANQGLYPNCGTSRDYGYGVMGYPTFTFETDDEQFVPGSVENLNERLAEELDVMKYLISNVWYWRARLDVQSLEISDDEITIDVSNYGQASTSNVSLRYVDVNGEQLWESPFFAVNATNSSMIALDGKNLSMTDDGSWELYYQVRVIESSRWVTEPINASVPVIIGSEEDNFLIGYGLFNPVTMIAGFAAIAALLQREESDEE